MGKALSFNSRQLFHDEEGEIQGVSVPLVFNKFRAVHTMQKASRQSEDMITLYGAFVPIFYVYVCVCMYASACACV